MRYRLVPKSMMTLKA